MYNTLEREKQHRGHLTRCEQWSSAGKRTSSPFQNIKRNQSVFCHQQQGKRSCRVHQAGPTSQTSPSLSHCNSKIDKKSPTSAIRHSLTSRSYCCIEHVPASKGARAEPRHVPSFLQGFSFGSGRLLPGSCPGQGTQHVGRAVAAHQR